MQLFDIGQIPTSIDITLYKYNYIDNKVWTQIHNEVEYIEYDKHSIMISKNQLEYIIEKHYAHSLNKIKSLGSEVVYKEINSIYFLSQMCNEMSNVKYIRVNLNLDKSYNRTIESESGDKLLQFGFKIVTATLPLYSLYNSDELKVVNGILEQVGVLKHEVPFVRIKGKDLCRIIETLLLSPVTVNEEDEIDFNILVDMLEILQPKLEPENALILLVTDY